MTVCELRLKAARVIEDRGWGTGKLGLHSSEGPVCILGALYIADPQGGDPYNPKPGSLRYWAIDALGFSMPGHRTAPTADRWNDAPDTTKEMVLARLRDGCTEP